MERAANRVISLSPSGEIEQFIEHLRKVAEWFNRATKAHGLPVRVSPEAAIEALRRGVGTKRASDYMNRADDSGILHEEQVVTAVAAIPHIIRGEKTGGLIKGAMQSGKTTTSLAMQFAAPVYYLITGKPLYPFYLLTVHTSQHEQTIHELQRFVGFYTNLTFRHVGQSPHSLDPRFAHSPTFENYREFVLQAGFEDAVFSQMMKPEDYVERRAPGRKISRIAERMKKIIDSGFVALMIIDEPQFGVMDHYDPETDKTKPSVFKRIFRAIEAELNMPPGTHRFVGLSATPYEMHDVEGIWVVSQKLSNNYTGFNMFAGNKIDETADCKPPKIHSLSEFASLSGTPFLAKLNLGAIGSALSFYRMQKKLGVPDGMTHDQYRDACIAALRDALEWLSRQHKQEVFGVCIRARNNNEFARTLERELKLGALYETLHYNGQEVRGRSVKHILAARSRPNDPYLLFVTNRARMGDAFPSSARYFIELAERFTDMNSMFQGFVGRACGYNKKSEVILSDYNAQMLRVVVAVEGGYIFQPSRGSTIVGRKRRGRPTSLITLRRDGDPKVEKFFSRIDEVFTSKRLKNVVDTHLRTRRQRGDGPHDFTHAPLFKEADRIKLFEHLEDKRNRGRFAEGYPDFHIVRPGERIASSGAVTGYIGYDLDGDGSCAVIVREYSGEDLKQGGVRGRGARGTSAGRKDQQQDCLMPQIFMRKYDMSTGRSIDDKEAAVRKRGVWKAYALTLPLDKAVTPLLTGEGTLPVPGTVIYDNLNAEERRTVRATLRKTSNGGIRP